MMRAKRIAPALLLALGLAAPGAARANLDASGVMLCALQEAIDCDASGTCSAGLPQDVNLFEATVAENIARRSRDASHRSLGESCPIDPVGAR